MMPPSGFQIRLRPRVTLTLWLPDFKVDGFMSFHSQLSCPSLLREPKPIMRICIEIRWFVFKISSLQVW